MINNVKLNLGELLLRQHVLDEDRLAHAISEHKRTGLSLAKVLVRLQMVSEDTLTSILGVQMQSATKMRIGEMLLAQGYITQDQLNKALLENFSIDNDAYTYLPEEMCKQYKVVPLFISKSDDDRRTMREALTLAMTDPTNMRVIQIVKFKVKMDVDVVMASEADVVKAIERVYAGHGPQEESLAELISESKDGEELETVERGQGGNDEPELSDEEGRAVVKIVTTLIHEAIARHASDIHLEPQETFLKLRYRIDGDLQVMAPIPARLMPQILSRIKLLSKMDIAEKRKPLDGRFTVRYKGSEVDLRVSSFPISLRKRGVCEKIVMRILDPNSGQFPLKDMGFDPRVFKQFIDAINAPNGIVLVTGPTGSGKSTTLYASIREILDSTINISTMEDPVELNIDGVNQGQINNAAGFTFAAGIRALLRQDPDVIMIGEMRDQETSSMAIEAALTGHLVFSTLHTNDAAGSFPRLLEMGLEPFLVSTAIKGILAQRLVRRICKYCKEPVEISDSLREELHLSPDMQFYHGKGCDKCDGSGYKGRCGIYEFLVPNESVRNLVIKRASGDEIKRCAMKECDMITLRMDGINKALQGLTTLEQAVGASAPDD